MVVVLQPSPAGLQGISLDDLLADRIVLADESDGEGRHIVVGAQGGRHRLNIRGESGGAGHVAAIIPDGRQPLRIAALESLSAVSRAKDDAAGRAPLHPSLAQRHRLVVMLGLLDRLALSRDQASLRDLAQHVVYPRLDLGRAIEWKTSPQRRQVQRLVGRARRLVRGDYRKLLIGEL